MPVWLSAGLWGLLGASSLLVGAALAYLVKLPRWATAGIMSFGCGVLISAVAYDLLEDGFQEGGIWPIVGGAIAGSIAYALADWLVSRNGAHHRKQSGDGEQQSAAQGGGLVIAIGSLLDGIPESIVLGLGLLAGNGISLAMLAAIFLSNLPEGLSSALGMKAAGRSRSYIFGLWAAIAVLSALASAIGAAAFGGAPPQLVAAVNAVAAGALLTMVVNTMIPEAVKGDRNLTGSLVVLGLLVAFSLSNLGSS
ncbi:putative integral membrane protein [Bradyrhizobium sp. ORS 375]|uniref:ZIP family metal transporter n=1 Tax=Bradyrhizobium sp. (strain ORS 375) TaxID=566679 RepID=UPI0002409618|nr:ZIP family metal transporter [Bradyrhizobium sp. ORS 375]CCD91617.1 putative integral membrane protein [Bradyrhizobium sp. ORS 375]